jgi:cytochrome c553
MKALWTLALLPGLAWGQTVSGRDLVMHGNNNGALPCAACHGADGAGNSAIGAPALAGLPAAGLAQDLNQMAQGEGGNEIMQSIASSLSPEERQAVADYFASLPKKK